MVNQTKLLTTDLKREFHRKFLHLLSISIPLLYIFLDFSVLVLILVFSLSIVLSWEYYRLDKINFKIKDRGLNNFYLKIMKIIDKIAIPILRKEERKNLTGATWLLSAALICIIVFKKELFIIAFSILGVSDTLAALIGKSFGKTKLHFSSSKASKNKDASNSPKTLEGTLAFLFSSLLILLLISGYYNMIRADFIIPGAISCIGTTAIELFSKNFNIDDNFSIPISFCGIFYIVGLMV